ncbi:MAG: mevalonate kinase [bacterium]
MRTPVIGTGTGAGFRKAILVNEHFVVYGVPAIAVPVLRPLSVAATLRQGTGLEILMRAPGEKKPRTTSDPFLAEAVRRILESCGASAGRTRVRLECRGSLYGWSGLGSSAAFCVAATKALCRALGHVWSDDQINTVAYEGEKVFASNPSGIDNTVSTFGRVLWYCRGREHPWEFLRPGAPIRLVVVNSGSPSLTKDQVRKVARFASEDPSRFHDLCSQASALALEARTALEHGAPRELGRLMDRGHEMLREIGASNDTLDRLVSLCRSGGSLGAKLTGAGGGGSLIALVENPTQAGRLARSIRALGYGAFAIQVSS